MKSGTPITDLRSRRPLTPSIGLQLRLQLRQTTRQQYHNDWLEPHFDPLRMWSLQPLQLLDDLFDAMLTAQT